MIKSVYIHIPFCNSICSYCDFCKMFYDKKLVDDYLDALNKEILLNYKGEIIDTIYIGGGTPSALNSEELEKLFNILKIFKLNKTYEYTFECNIESIDELKLKILSVNGVNRLSIGIETFNNKFLNYLNRNHNEDDIKKIEICKKYFNNINVDLMYAFKNQTIEDVKNDIKQFVKLDVPHISTYSLIIEPHTKLYINKEKNIDEDLDFKMYDYICKELKNHGFNHYEISNFAKEGYESKHNLNYWNNNEYYGFGLGAGGFVNNVRYSNTRNINKYISGSYLSEQEEMDINTNIENELILGFRKTNGIDVDVVNKKYNINIEDNINIKRLLDEKKLIKENNHIFINDKYLYLSNEILINFIGDV